MLNVRSLDTPDRQTHTYTNNESMIKLCFRHKGCTKINTKIVFQVECCVQTKLSHACR